MKSATAAVLALVSDLTHQRSQLVLVLQVLLANERDGRWMTVGEIAEAAGRMRPRSAGSRIRDLRVVGFTIKKAKRVCPGSAVGVVWEFRLFP